MGRMTADVRCDVGKARARARAREACTVEEDECLVDIVRLDCCEECSSQELVKRHNGGWTRMVMMMMVAGGRSDRIDSSAKSKNKA